jgi:mono/diheme cytochrome c family protein
VLGYLHGNCGHCHNSRAQLANLGLFLRQELLLGKQAAVETTVRQPVKKSAPGQSADALLRVDPGHPERSALFERVSSRYPALQMPPLGTALVDDEAVAVVRKWIMELGADDGR